MMKSASRLVPSAAPKGASRACPNWFWITFPIIGTFVQSFYSTPKLRRPSRFVGLENYEQLIDDPIFWKVLWNNAAGKRATEFFVHTLKSIAPPGVVEYDSDQEGGAILGGKALSIVQYSGNAIKSDDPKQAPKVHGKLDFGTVPRGPGGSIAQIGIFISGLSVSAPNQDNASMSRPTGSRLKGRCRRPSRAS